MELLKSIEKFFKKRIKVFGSSHMLANFIVITLMTILCAINIISFILAIIHNDFNAAILDIFIFTWNSAILYFNYLQNVNFIFKEDSINKIMNGLS